MSILSSYFLCFSKSDLFLKPQLSPVLRRAPWVHRELSLTKLPRYFHPESLVGFGVSPSWRSHSLAPGRRASFLS